MSTDRWRGEVESILCQDGSWLTVGGILRRGINGTAVTYVLSVSKKDCPESGVACERCQRARKQRASIPSYVKHLQHPRMGFKGHITLLSLKIHALCESDSNLLAAEGGIEFAIGNGEGSRHHAGAQSGPLLKGPVFEA